MSLPPGFRFHPTDKELVEHYLLKKHAGTLPPVEWVKECDLYGKQEPWEIWEKFGGNRLTSVEDDLFFFTTLKKKNSTHASRRVGSSGGTWHRDDKDKKLEVMAPVEVVMKKFSYHRNKNKSYPWMLIEYSVKNSSMSDLVVCRLRLKRSAGKRKANKYDNNCEEWPDENKRSRVDVEEPVSNSNPPTDTDTDTDTVGGDQIEIVSNSNPFTDTDTVGGDQIEIEGFVSSYEDLVESDWDKPSHCFNVDDILNLNDPISDQVLEGDEIVRVPAPADCVETAQLDKPLMDCTSNYDQWFDYDSNESAMMSLNGTPGFPHSYLEVTGCLREIAESTGYLTQLERESNMRSEVGHYAPHLHFSAETNYYDPGYGQLGSLSSPYAQLVVPASDRMGIMPAMPPH